MLRINGKFMAVKDIRTKIKYGATPQELADFFEVSETEFMQNLKNRLGQTFSEYERELRKNKKRKIQSLRKKSAPTDVSEEESIEEVVGDELVESSEAETQNEEESLREKLFIIQSSMEKEQERYRTVENETARIDAAIDSVRIKLSDICKVVKSYEKSLREFEKERADIVKERESAYEEIKRLEAEYQLVETELQAYREVKVTCTKDGITVSQSGFEPSEEDVETKYMELSKMEAMDDYSVKQVRLAARVLCVIELLEVMEKKYSIVYEEVLSTIDEIVRIVLEA